MKKELVKGLVAVAIWTVVGLAVYRHPEVTSGTLWLAFWATLATGAIFSK